MILSRKFTTAEFWLEAVSEEPPGLTSFPPLGAVFIFAVLRVVGDILNDVGKLESLFVWKWQR